MQKHSCKIQKNITGYFENIRCSKENKFDENKIISFALKARGGAV